MVIQKTNLPNKVTGQQHTATEYNLVKNVIDNNADELALKSNDNDVIHKLGNVQENITGIKMFYDQIQIGVPNDLNLNNPIGISVNKTLTVLNNHAFEDNNFLQPTSPTEILGYCSFDAKVIMDNINPIDHYSAFQARPVYQGSSDIVNYINGLRVFANHVGTGDLPAFSGIRIDDIDGTGPVRSDYGIFINEIKRGYFENWNIYTIGGAQRFGGKTYCDDKLSINTDLSDYTLNVEGISYFTGTHQQNGNIQQLSEGSIKSALFLSPNINPTKYCIQTILDVSISLQPATIETVLLTPNLVTITGKATVSTAPTNPTDVVRKTELDLKAPINNPSFTGVTKLIVSEYADNAAALVGGLVIGSIYRTGDLLKIVH